LCQSNFLKEKRLAQFSKSRGKIGLKPGRFPHRIRVLLGGGSSGFPRVINRTTTAMIISTIRPKKIFGAVKKLGPGVGVGVACGAFLFAI